MVIIRVIPVADDAKAHPSVCRSALEAFKRELSRVALSWTPTGPGVTFGDYVTPDRDHGNDT